MENKKKEYTKKLEAKVNSVISASLAALSIGSINSKAIRPNLKEADNAYQLEVHNENKIKKKPKLVLKFNYADPHSSSTFMHTSHSSHSSHSSHYSSSHSSHTSHISHYSSSSSSTSNSSSATLSSTDQSNIIKKYSGSGLKNTEPFTTTEPWKIKWTSEADSMEIYLCNLKGNIKKLLVKQGSKNSGTSFSPKTGKFYLRVISKMRWQIEIISDK